ncbi:hypothetical protein PSTG_10072 [Puccinia striiformis f. sp. tritici PST-78]|uniref:Uncharacterized protein n=1 Tax=Puccinia striiformis f. sp. tritici PST-78 TaxID=1165861 RepID=A0A0L0VBM2_9BASI|nr:hypothetical protein PSTG_10072 [Puccinia striiformis f. sp. tritici PST-78]
MRQGLRSAGAVARGTTHINKIGTNTDPWKLLDRILTNHKDITPVTPTIFGLKPMMFLHFSLA